jgi:hypothetical protein
VRTIKPILKIGNHDYTAWLAEDGLAPVRNDIDADGSGRNLLDGLMYRARIAQKDKWTVKFNRMPELIMRSLAADVDGEYTDITFLDPKTDRIMTKTYYTSTLTYGTQRYDKGDNRTYYEGCTFNMTER